ncbi:flagellar biosynthesis protein FlhB [Mucisphaera calidilacus]|uniref:Flagellar biosynthetic protein FlhB n=1 Tax=Mucisphaera calidilacus TaxID=2527982 RepID=A0A518BYX5_9BACT|nr:flagellar biosynthesis protein FlhB [Mucisphaera calidilacus]QDU72171.1 Flagellar biosynthetic protein FlhB [Mucisphaera calidilacus]
MAESAQEKTEPATPRRRQKAREEGNVAKSMDLTASVALLLGVALLYMLGRQMFGGMKGLVERALRADFASNPARAEDLVAALADGIYVYVELAAPFMGAMAFVALVATLYQVGLLLTTKPLAPKLSKFNLIKGAQQMVNLRALMRFVQSMLKVVLLLGLGGLLVYLDIEKLLHLALLDVEPAFAGACELVFSLSVKLALMLLILGVIDYAYQKWQHEEELKMSKQDVKEEMRNMDGDPMVKQRRARVARQLAMQRVSAAVPQADVIVTNPTHFAVALKYDASTMKAPKVLAKGADYLAMRIRQIAAVHGVPVVERKELARALYREVDPGMEIPGEHYAAVAEILAYVYRLSKQQTA